MKNPLPFYTGTGLLVKLVKSFVEVRTMTYMAYSIDLSAFLYHHSSLHETIAQLHACFFKAVAKQNAEF